MALEQGLPAMACAESSSLGDSSIVSPSVGHSPGDLDDKDCEIIADEMLRRHVLQQTPPAKQKPWQSALSALSFSRRRIAGDVKKVLQSAIANAENNHSLDVDRLKVKEAHVGKGLVMKRFKARARGRGARILKPFAHLTIVVAEKEEQA